MADRIATCDPLTKPPSRGDFQFGFINMAENFFLPVFPVFNFPKP